MSPKRRDAEIRVHPVFVDAVGAGARRAPDAAVHVDRREVARDRRL